MNRPECTDVAIRRLYAVMEPYNLMLMDLYNRSLPTITVSSDGTLIEHKYSPEVEEMAARIRKEQRKAMEQELGGLML